MTTSSVTNIVLNDEFPSLPSVQMGRIELDYIDTPREVTLGFVDTPRYANPRKFNKFMTTALSLATSPRLNQTLNPLPPPSTSIDTHAQDEEVPRRPDIRVRLPGRKKKKFTPLICPTCNKDKYDHVTW